MKKILSVLLLLMSSQVFAAANLPASSSVSAGGGSPASTSTASFPQFNFPLSSLSSLYKICASNNAGTASAYSALYSQHSPNANKKAFQVPTGQTFYALSMHAYTTAATTNGTFQIVTGTDQLINDVTATAPAGAIPYGFDATAAGWAYNETASKYTSYDLSGTSFPALSWPVIRNGTTTNTFGICITGVLQ